MTEKQNSGDTSETAPDTTGGSLAEPAAGHPGDSVIDLDAGSLRTVGSEVDDTADIPLGVGADVERDSRLTFLSVTVGVLAVALAVVVYLLAFDPAGLAGLVPDALAEPGPGRSLLALLAGLVIATPAGYLFRAARAERRPVLTPER